MTTEELRRHSLEQYATLRRKAMFEAQQNAPITVTPNAAAGSSSGGSSSVLTPFIIQAWGITSTVDWSLYRLTSDGTKIPVVNAPPLEGPTVFSKNTLNGLHYYVTNNGTTTNFGMWDSLTGEWQFLEEGTSTLLRNLAPASLQYIEGVEGNGNYFIYTDNSQYIGTGTDNIAPITFRIDLDTPTSFELTELHAWETPIDLGTFPISTFYQLPVDTEAIPPQDLFQVEQYGLISGPGIPPLAVLSSINGDTYERTNLGLMEINGLPIEAVKIAYILDRTDYGGDIYFNVFAIDKINESEIAYIAKFDPENPTNLTSIYQYVWDNAPYVGLTTI
jgi:hypothetical protein